MSRYKLKGLASGDEITIGFDEALGGLVYVHLNEDFLQDCIDNNESPDLVNCWALDFLIFDRFGQPDQSALEDALIYAQSFAELPNHVSFSLKADCEVIWKRGMEGVSKDARYLFEEYNRAFRDDLGFRLFVDKLMPMFIRPETSLLPAARERMRNDARRLGEYADKLGGLPAMQEVYYAIPRRGGLRNWVEHAWDGIGQWRS